MCFTCIDCVRGWNNYFLVVLTIFFFFSSFFFVNWEYVSYLKNRKNIILKICISNMNFASLRCLDIFIFAITHGKCISDIGYRYVRISSWWLFRLVSYKCSMRSNIIEVLSLVKNELPLIMLTMTGIRHNRSRVIISIAIISIVITSIIRGVIICCKWYTYNLQRASNILY